MGGTAAGSSGLKPFYVLHNLILLGVSGIIRRTHSPLIIGHGQGYQNFTGYIDEVSEKKRPTPNAFCTHTHSESVCFNTFVLGVDFVLNE